MAHALRSPDVSERLASFAMSESLGNLVPTELRLPTELYSSCLRSLPPFIGLGLDQMPLEGSEPGEYRNHKLAIWSSGIGPGIGQ